MVRPERVRVSMTQPAADEAVAATVVDLTFQGPVLRLSLTAPTTPRSSRTWALNRTSAAAAGRPGLRRLVTGGFAGAARGRQPNHPRSRRNARRLKGNSGRHQSPVDPQVLARLASRRRFIGGGAAAAAALVLGPSFLAACGSDKSGSNTPAAPSDDGSPASGKLRVSNWPLYMADGFVAAFQTATGLTVDYKEDFQRQRGVVRQEQGAAVT